MNPRNPLVWAVLATACIVVSAVAFGIRAVLVAGNEAHHAVCAIKVSDRRQYATTNRYLRDNPDILKKLGISRAEVIRGQTELQTQLRALRGVNCP